MTGDELAAPDGRPVDCEPVHKARGAFGLDLRERRELYNGFGDTLARAVELVAVPAVFALGGHALDGLAGTGPLLAVALAVFALAGVFVRAYFAYEVAMKAHEAERPWARPAPARRGPS